MSIETPTIESNRAEMIEDLRTWEPNRWTPFQLVEMSTPAIAAEWERADHANQERARA